jgi:hypothetical protein
MLGPWTIPKDDKKKRTKAKDKTIIAMQELLVLRCLDPDTYSIEMIALASKASILVAQAFNQIWLCCYPRPLECIHNAGTKFTGFEIQEL